MIRDLETSCVNAGFPTFRLMMCSFMHLVTLQFVETAEMH